MTLAGWLQFGLLAVVVVALIPPLGRYMAEVFSGAPSLLRPVLGPVERMVYRLWPTPWMCSASTSSARRSSTPC